MGDCGKKKKQKQNELLFNLQCDVLALYDTNRIFLRLASFATNTTQSLKCRQIFKNPTLLEVPWNFYSYVSDVNESD